MGTKALLLILPGEKHRLRLRLKFSLQVIREQIRSTLFPLFHTAVLNVMMYLQEPQKYANTVLLQFLKCKNNKPSILMYNSMIYISTHTNLYQRNKKVHIFVRGLKYRIF